MNNTQKAVQRNITGNALIIFDYYTTLYIYTYMVHVQIYKKVYIYIQK